MSTQNPAVDAFVQGSEKWRSEIRTLRSILLDCGLDEKLKWGKPCFQFDGNNVAIIQPFKEHCALMFFKGALIARGADREVHPEDTRWQRLPRSLRRRRSRR